MFGKKKEKYSSLRIIKKERNQLEHKNVTELVLVTLRDGVEEGRGEILERRKGSNDLERIERGAV